MNIGSEHTGRFFVYAKDKNGKNRKFLVEPIEPRNMQDTTWGDIDPATKTVTGSYGDKYRGAIEEKDSIITTENGFKNIQYGQNPFDMIDKILKS